MANYRRSRNDVYRPSENTYENFQRRDNDPEGSYGDFGNAGTRDFDRHHPKGFSTDGAYPEQGLDRRDYDEDWRVRGYSNENFSGSNEDYDHAFGMNRRGRPRTDYGNYTNPDYSNSPLGVRSNYSYNRGGFGSNFGGEYGHYGKNDQWMRDNDERFTNDATNRYRGWGWGNPEREYSSYTGRYDDDYNERWQRDNRDWVDRTGDEIKSWFGDEDAERRRRVDHWKDRHDEVMDHRGKGPRNYKRSDTRILEDINDRLSDDPWVDASDVEVAVNNCEVTLTGNVSDRFAKRRAEDLAEMIPGVRHVENRLRVDHQSFAHAAGLRKREY